MTAGGPQPDDPSWRGGFTSDQIDVLQHLANRLLELRAAGWILRWVWLIGRWAGWMAFFIIAWRTGSLPAAFKFIVTGN